MTLEEFSRMCWNGSKTESQPDFDTLEPVYRDRLLVRAQWVVDRGECQGDGWADFENAIMRNLRTYTVPKSWEIGVEVKTEVPTPKKRATKKK